MIKSNFCIVVLAILLFACQTNDSKERIEEDYTHELFACPNEEWLFASEDSLPVLELDYSLENDSLRNFVIQQLEISDCNVKRYFELKLTEGTLMLLSIEIPCEDDFLPSFGNPIEILVNKHNQILVESEYVEIDSINSFIKNNFKEKATFSDGYIRITLLWD